MAVDGFQDAKWGMSPDQVRAVLPARTCRTNRKTVDGLDELQCVEGVGGVERASVRYYFDDLRLQQVFVDASVGDNQGVQIGRGIQLALIAKYGDPDADYTARPSVCQANTISATSRWPMEGIDALSGDSGDRSLVLICYYDVATAGKEAAGRAKAVDAAAKAAVDKTAGDL
jgi:hypothetical protein